VKRRPPQWYQFGWWVVAGALVGLGIAFGLFCVVHFLLYGNFAFIKHMQAIAKATEVKPADIFSMTATALGGFTIGGVAVMQYRKHKWAEYQADYQARYAEHQAKLEEDTRTGERLSRVIEHLGNGDAGADTGLHIRLGAIYEFKNLAEDYPRDIENIVQILVAFIKSYEVVEGRKLPQDMEVAMKVLSQLVRELIEGTTEKNKIGCVFEATKSLSSASITQSNHKIGLELKELRLNHRNLMGIHLEKANLCLAHLAGAFLYEANLKGTILDHADLAGAILHDAHLEAADLRLAGLQDADLTKAHLEGADLSYALLEGADLRNVSIDSETILHLACIDAYTRFDPGVRMKYYGVEEPEHRDDTKKPHRRLNI